MQETITHQAFKTRRRWILLACLLGMFMAAIEATIVGTAMPAIVAELGDVGLLGWVFSAYMVAQALTIPLYGRLADLHGRGKVFSAGVLIFLIGSTLCGFSRSLTQLIVFRVLQGMGAGAIMPVSMTIVGDLYKGAERGRVQGALSSVWGISAVIGPLLGALIVSTTGWPVVFWLNLPVGLASIVLLAVFLKEPSTSPFAGAGDGLQHRRQRRLAGSAPAPRLLQRRRQAAPAWVARSQRRAAVAWPSLVALYLLWAAGCWRCSPVPVHSPGCSLALH